MPAADAGSALIAGKVPVAVTYEPYISLAKAQNAKINLLFSAGENPGLISDVFVVREDYLAEKPGQVLALLKSWDAALADYKADTNGGRAIISEAVGAKPKNSLPPSTASPIIRWRKTDYLAGDFLGKVVPEVEAAARGRHSHH